MLPKNFPGRKNARRAKALEQRKNEYSLFGSELSHYERIQREIENIERNMRPPVVTIETPEI